MYTVKYMCTRKRKMMMSECNFCKAIQLEQLVYSQCTQIKLFLFDSTFFQYIGDDDDRHHSDDDNPHTCHTVILKIEKILNGKLTKVKKTDSICTKKMQIQVKL